MPMLKNSKNDLVAAKMAEDLILSMNPTSLTAYLKMKARFAGSTIELERKKWNRMVADATSIFKKHGLENRLTPEAIAAHQRKVRKNVSAQKTRRNAPRDTSGNPRSEPIDREYTTKEFRGENGSTITIRERNWGDGR